MIIPKPKKTSLFLAALRATQEEAKRTGMDKLTAKQINAQIAAVRKEKRQKATGRGAK